MYWKVVCAVMFLTTTSLMVSVAAFAEHEAARLAYQSALATYEQARIANDAARERRRLACRVTATDRDACSAAEAAFDAAFTKAKEAKAEVQAAKYRYEAAKARHK